MPGLSQLKKFSSDLLDLGDEVSLRSGRGEKPVTVPIPDDVKDFNDADDFVIGMPDADESPSDHPADASDISDDDDLASFAAEMGFGPDTSSGSGDTPFDAPDLSSILDPIGNDNVDSSSIPDLSMFADDNSNAENLEEIPEEDNVPVSDMNLEDLLAESGFDDPKSNIGSEDISASPSADDLFYEPFDDVPVTEDETEIEEPPVVEPAPEEIDSSFEDLVDGLDNEPLPESIDENPFEEPVVQDAEEVPASEDIPVEDISDLPDMSDISEPESVESIDDLDSPFESITDSDISQDESPFGDISSEDNSAEPSLDTDFSTDDMENSPFSLDTDEENSPFDDMGDLSDNDNIDENIESSTDNTESDNDLFDMPDIDSSPFDFGDDNSSENDSSTFDIPEDDAVAPENIDTSFDIPDMPVENTFGDSDSSSENPFGDDNNAENLGNPFGDNENNLASFEDFGESGKEDDRFDDIGDVLDSPFDNVTPPSDSAPIETLDTSSIDFDIPETDSQLENIEGSGDDFDLGGDFEIPGFSDVETVDDNVSSGGKKNKSPEKQSSSGKGDDDEGNSDLPPHTLTLKQYKTLKENLNEYPLNVRLAFEEVLVKDEFTDDVEFELIEMILNKAPARSVAARLSKILDIVLTVPRDYEGRTSAEYEAYKKSLSYQLRNKIIPAIILGVVCLFVCIGLFNFGKHCIYKPMKASNLYKQGYTLLQQGEYPLSEIKFNEATSYRLNKKWFFNYAQGYRDHKQYQRAGKMFENILYCFNHDKEAGLQYADMELEDLANYERAEEIVRREVLDYHINDADGLLKLGDIFLEWGTEKDPSKLEDAREQYTTLMQLYGEEDLYISRLMRYYIRADKFRDVLQIKERFNEREDSLSSDDLTELSGYLLDKYYGELSPDEEYLRYEIEGLRDLLMKAVNSNPENPVASYNLARYFINTSENEFIESTLKSTIEKFNDAKVIKNRDIYKYIDSYKLLGEYYANTEDYLQAQEQYAEGISLYLTERDNAGFKGNSDIGKLYEDMGDLKYTISGDYDEALINYNQSVSLGNDSPKIRYRIGYVNYNNRNYKDALSSFMKAGDGNIKERNLLLAMANTLSLRGDDYAAEGYYEQLINKLDSEIANKGLLLPQANGKDYNIVNSYLCASNNYGVTLHRLAKKTGDSSKNAEAIVQFSQSLRAWDALTRNPETMVRLEGSNLAEQNIKYLTHPISEFEPAIYTNIPRTLMDNEKL